jgi:hypothetical protein
MDCVVKSWIAGTISADLAETAIDRNATARTVWRTLEDQLHGNWEACVLQLDVKFRNFVQGDLLVTNYSRELKGMATTLRDLGEDVTDRTLTLNLIRGLNERFRDVDRLLRRDSPFPQFKDTVKELLLVEMTSAPPSSTPPTALLAAGQAAAPGASQSTQRPKSPRNGGSQSGAPSLVAPLVPARTTAAKTIAATSRALRGTHPPPPMADRPAARAPRRPSQAVLAAPPGPPSYSRGPGPSRCGPTPALPRHCLRHRLSSNRPQAQALLAQQAQTYAIHQAQALAQHQAAQAAQGQA